MEPQPRNSAKTLENGLKSSPTSQPKTLDLTSGVKWLYVCIAEFRLVMVFFKHCSSPGFSGCTVAVPDTIHTVSDFQTGELPASPRFQHPDTQRHVSQSRRGGNGEILGACLQFFSFWLGKLLVKARRANLAWQYHKHGERL